MLIKVISKRMKSWRKDKFLVNPETKSRHQPIHNRGGVFYEVPEYYGERLLSIDPILFEKANKDLSPGEVLNGVDLKKIDYENLQTTYSRATKKNPVGVSRESLIAELESMGQDDKPAEKTSRRKRSDI